MSYYYLAMFWLFVCNVCTKYFNTSVIQKKGQADTTKGQLHNKKSRHDVA